MYTHRTLRYPATYIP